MSIDALSWAFKQDVRPATRKFVLVALCDYAGEEWSAFPSIKKLCEKTCLDRKTVVQALSKLVETGYLTDTGERKGSTQQVKVYQIRVPKTEPFEESEKSTDFPGKSTVFPHKESRKRDTEPLGNRQGTLSCSVPTGTGADAPPTDLFGGKPPPKEPDTLTEDARSQMWRMGVSLLTNQGLAESTARGLIGKWAKQGEKKLAGVIGECAVKPPADARAYINAAMQNAYNLYDEKQLQAAAKAYGVKIKQQDTWDTLRARVQDAIRGGKAA